MFWTSFSGVPKLIIIFIIIREIKAPSVEYAIPLDEFFFPTNNSEVLSRECIYVSPVKYDMLIKAHT